MTREEYISYLANQVSNGQIDLHRVREELKRHGLNETQTKKMIRVVDDQVISLSVMEEKRKRGNSYILVGSLMATAGFITSVVFLGSGPLVYFIGYGPFTTGLGLIVTGRRIRQVEPDIKAQRMAGRFRKRLKV